MARRCITTTRSFRSTTAKKISLRVRRFMGSGAESNHEPPKNHEAGGYAGKPALAMKVPEQRPVAAAVEQAAERRKNAAHGVSRG